MEGKSNWIESYSQKKQPEYIHLFTTFLQFSCSLPASSDFLLLEIEWEERGDLPHSISSTYQNHQVLCGIYVACHDHVHLFCHYCCSLGHFQKFKYLVQWANVNMGVEYNMRYNKKIERNVRRNHFCASLKQIMNLNWIEFFGVHDEKKKIFILHREIEQTNHQWIIYRY